MACVFVVKDPITGEEVDSLLYKDLVEYYNSEAEAELAYRSAIDSPKFLTEFGDYHKSPSNYLLTDEKGKPRLDKYNEPFASDVVKYYANWELSKKSHNINELKNVTTPGLARLQKVVDTLTTRLHNLRRVKKTIHEKEKLRTQIGNLLKQIGEANEIRGFVNYTRNAVTEVNHLLDSLIEHDKSGTPFTAAQLGHMFKVIQSYRDVNRILGEAQQLEDSKDLELGKQYYLPSIVIKNLNNLKDTLSKLENEYQKRALESVANSIMGSDYQANAREFYRRSYAETAEGKRRKDETNTTYRKRIQEHVDLKMQDNSVIIEKDAKEHIMRLLSAGIDITYLERWALNASNTTSPILRSLNHFILKAEDIARLTWIKFAEEGDILFRRYKKHMKSLGKNENNLSEFFELIGERSYDKNGKLSKKGTGWVTHRWHSVWHTDLKTIRRAMSQIRKKATRNALGQIDPTASIKDKKLKRVYDALRRLYYVNKDYDADPAIARQKERISASYEGVRDLEKAILKKQKIVDTLKNLENLTMEQSNRIPKLEKELYEALEQRAKLLSDAVSLENNLRDEFFNFEDIYHVPNLKRIRADKKDLQRLLKSVNISFDLAVSTEMYKSPQYEEIHNERKKDAQSPVYEYYKKFVMKGMKMRDSVRPEEFKTGFKYDAIRKVLWERFDDVRQGEKPINNAWNNWTKSYLKEIFTYTKGRDIESGVQLKAIGEAIDTKIDYVPIFFTKQIDLKDQQMHLHQNLLVGNFVSVNYNEKNKILPYIEMLMSVVQNRKIIKTKGFQRIFKNLSGVVADAIGKSLKKEKKQESNTYANAMDLIASRIFGETVQEAGITLPLPFTESRLSIRQLWNLWLSATSTVLLSANWMSTISNRVLGGTLHLSEALAGEFFTTKSMLNGQKYYIQDDPQIINDIGKPFPISKTNLLGMLFDPLNDYSMYGHQYAYNNKMKALLNTNTLHGLNNMAEHAMHHVVMYTVLAETKVLNKEGEYINKSGKGITKDRTKAMDLASMYKTEKRGEEGHRGLNLDNRVHQIEYRVAETYYKMPLVGKLHTDMSIRAEQEETNMHAIIKLTQLIQKINEMEHGAYSQRNAPPGRRHALFQGLETMRKFFPVGIKHRLQGIGTTLLNLFTNFPEFARTRGNAAFFKDSAKYSNDSTKIYDPITNNLKESHYVTTLKYFAFSAYHGMKKLGQLWARTHDDTYQVKKGILSMSKEEWGNMSKHEKANIVRTFYEIGLAMVLMQAAHALKDRGEEKSDYMFAFFMARLSTELLAYSNPWEAARILQSPATTTTFIERIWTFMDQLGEDIWAGEWERYKAGSRKGQTKTSKNLGDIVPWHKAVNRHKYVEDILNYHYRE